MQIKVWEKELGCPGRLQALSEQWVEMAGSGRSAQGQEELSTQDSCPQVGQKTVSGGRERPALGRWS